MFTGRKIPGRALLIANGVVLDTPPSLNWGPESTPEQRYHVIKTILTHLKRPREPKPWLVDDFHAQFDALLCKDNWELSDTDLDLERSS